MKLNEIVIGTTYALIDTNEEVTIVEKTARTAKYEDDEGNLQSVFAKDLIPVEGEVTMADLESDEDDVDEDDADEDGSKMAAHIRKYRSGYEGDLSYSNTRTLHNGDGVALALKRLAPMEVCKVAMDLIEDCPNLREKYAALNPGQIRMSAGNRIRNAVKQGELEVDAIEALAAEIIEARPAE